MTPGAGGAAANDTGGTQGDTGGTQGDTGGTQGDTGGTQGDTGGTQGDTGGSAGSVTCEKVDCPNIPTSCKKLVQAPGACCPTCLDTGCEPCATVDCDDGYHAETLAGACCPTCVADPPDACEVGQKTYDDVRQQMLEKYGSSGCQNSSDCALVLEDTKCSYVCNVPLPSSTVRNFLDNVQSLASPGCQTCDAPEQYTCMKKLPACVNAKCTAVDIGG
jgi:hypothetical protein